MMEFQHTMVITLNQEVWIGQGLKWNIFWWNSSMPIQLQPRWTLNKPRWWSLLWIKMSLDWTRILAEWMSFGWTAPCYYDRFNTLWRWTFLSFKKSVFDKDKQKGCGPTTLVEYTAFSVDHFYISVDTNIQSSSNTPLFVDL